MKLMKEAFPSNPTMKRHAHESLVIWLVFLLPMTLTAFVLTGSLLDTIILVVVLRVLLLIFEAIARKQDLQRVVNKAKGGE